MDRNCFYSNFTTHVTSICEKKKLINIFTKVRKENVDKSKQISGRKLSHLAEMKFNFLM